MISTVKKTVFISGNFNIIHPGHIRLFKFAKQFGSKLVVGINSDNVAGSNAYIEQSLRLENAKNYTMIDEVLLIGQSLEGTILDLKPSILLK